MTRARLPRAARFSLGCFAGLLLMGACGDDASIAPDPCAEVAVPLALMAPTAAEVIAFTESLRADIYQSCAELVRALGPLPVAALSAPSDEQVEAMCAEAQRLVDEASPMDFLLAVSSAHCRIDHEAQLACEASCQKSSECDPGTVQTRCPDLKLSGQCTAACPATCEGRPATPTYCEGKCFGACTGTCVGTTTGAICEGSCLGTCGGDCALPESSTVACSDGVRCLSRCDGAWSELGCESRLVDSSCAASGFCFAACTAAGVFGARCELASLASEGLNPTLRDSIAQSYPLLLSLPTYEALFVEPALLLVAAYDVLLADGPVAECPGGRGRSLAEARDQLSDAAASLLCLTGRLEAPPCLEGL
jgi:hypothetical protein